jgi:ribonuclease R
MTKKKSKKAQLQHVSHHEKLFQNLLKITYEFIKGRHYSPQSKTTLIERLRIHPDHFSIFDSVLKSLKEEGKVHISGDKYLHVQKESGKTTPNKQLITGTIIVHPRGFGFVQQPDPTQDDVFIPKPYMNGAVDGDTVEVLVSDVVSEKGPEGKVISIVKRTRKQLVGIVAKISPNKVYAYCSMLGEANFVTVLPDGVIEPLVVGDRVLLDVMEWGAKADAIKAVLNRKIGHISDPSKDITQAILEYGIREDFPKEVEEEAASFGTKVTAQDMKGREDLRDLECFTIDPDTAKDYDDALSLEKKGDHYLIGVHIADVSHYVQPHSALDKEARLRCNSTYFPGLSVPMLPRALSDNLCSLKEGVVRLTVTVFAEIDKHGTIRNVRIVRSAIKSAKRFTYKEVKQILDGNLKNKHKSTLEEMVKVCHLLKKKRAERGSVQLYMPELVVKVDQDGNPIGTEVVEYDITHQMVEEFMLLANELVAIHLGKQGKSLTYRVHEEPAKESLKEFASLVLAFGYNIPKEPTPQDIQKFFSEIEESPFSQYLATCYIRSMRLACYAADNIGHYGLSLEHYCHFTSPIRRYVDTIVHRLLFSDPIDKHVIEEVCKMASEKERLSAKAENSVVYLKKLRLLDRYRKENRMRMYEAVVTRVKGFGIYFDILELMQEGFLHISDLDNDYFVFDETRMQLFGRSTHIAYRAGDTLTVRLKELNFITLQTSWELISHSMKQKVDEEVRGEKKSKKKK